MTKKNIGKHVVEEIKRLLKANKAIVFGADFADNEYSEIRWSQYGLIENNEVAVMVTCGSKAFAAKAQSALQMPAMADRVWGMDALDEYLASKLGEKLWKSFSDELVREVKLLRRKNKDCKSKKYQRPYRSCQDDHKAL
ncbi:MAG TPA: hypothetical protein VN328_09725 [Thermodesulfovibrionales bacterium]|nr:hypothetical protein [Thermodesulfovibrionales bacterium]